MHAHGTKLWKAKRFAVLSDPRLPIKRWAAIAKFDSQCNHCKQWGQQYHGGQRQAKVQCAFKHRKSMSMQPPIGSYAIEIKMFCEQVGSGCHWLGSHVEPLCKLNHFGQMYLSSTCTPTCYSFVKTFAVLKKQTNVGNHRQQKVRAGEGSGVAL